MKLLIILICIASERYLVHMASQYRYTWFDAYYNFMTNHLPKTAVFNNSYVILLWLLLPVMLLSWIVLALLANLLYGFVGFLLNLIILYFCLGPENPFYPVRKEGEDLEKEEAVGNYFVKVNNQLFAVIFWFTFTGPLVVILYRLLYFCSESSLTEAAALPILRCFDWVAARVTTLLYLLVGNFQQGFQYYSKMFLAPPAKNSELLSTGGLRALEIKEGEKASLPHAQILVEHALVVYLVFLAFFTLVAWL